MSKQITGMKVVMFSLLLLLRYFVSTSRMFKSAFYSEKFTSMWLSKQMNLEVEMIDLWIKFLLEFFHSPYDEVL